MRICLEDWFRFLGFKLGSELPNALSTAVGVSPSIGERVVIVLDFVTGTTPAIIMRRLFRIGDQKAYQFLFPPPSFFVFLGSASTGPDLVKKRGSCSWGVASASLIKERSRSLALWERVTGSVSEVELSRHIC